MARPVATEMVRTSYIIACMLLDVILVPGLCISFAGRLGLIVALILIVPLAYFEHRAHQAWFPPPAPEQAKPDRKEPL